MAVSGCVSRPATCSPREEAGEFLSVYVVTRLPRWQTGSAVTQRFRSKLIGERVIIGYWVNSYFGRSTNPAWRCWQGCENGATGWRGMVGAFRTEPQSGEDPRGGGRGFLEDAQPRLAVAEPKIREVEGPAAGRTVSQCGVEREVPVGVKSLASDLGGQDRCPRSEHHVGISEDRDLERIQVRLLQLQGSVLLPVPLPGCTSSRSPLGLPPCLLQLPAQGSPCRLSRAALRRPAPRFFVALPHFLQIIYGSSRDAVGSLRARAS